jgi:hypothetical protein
MRSQAKLRRANQIAYIFHDQQIELLQVKLCECTVQHDRIEVTFPTGVHLNGCTGTCRGSTIGINRGSDVTIYDGDAQSFLLQEKPSS